MKHKHAELICAWADGAEIEYKDYDGRWYVIKYPMWHDHTEYRIKPEPPKEPAQPNIQISQLENQLQACRKLVDEKDEKIVELATKLAYAELDLKLIIDEAKLQELQEQEPQYLYVYNHISVGKPLMSPTLMRDTSDWIYLGKVRVEK
jgi:hypothetical protein